MNMRRKELVEIALDRLETKEIKDGDLLLVYLPDDIFKVQADMVGEIIQRAVDATGKKPQVLIMPQGMLLQTIPEETMKRLGWVRDVTTTTSDTEHNRLPEYRESPEVPEDKQQEHKVRKGPTFDDVKSSISKWLEGSGVGLY